MTTATVIPSPIVASTPSLAAALRAEPTIQQVLKQACSVEQALVGVGTPAPDATIVQMGYLTKADARRLREMGVVGDILGQFFDASGNVVDLPIHERRIGIELADLRRIPKVVAVAGGLHKAEAILGALHGKFARRPGDQRAGRDAPARARERARPGLPQPILSGHDTDGGVRRDRGLV